MSAPTDTGETVSLLITRLLEGPARPGQAFTMPGCNYGDLYRMAGRIKFFFDDYPDADGPVCICCDDRTVMAAALLASLAGGPSLLLPHALSAAALLELRQLTGFTRAIAAPDGLLPAGVTNIDPGALIDEVETLASDSEPDPDRAWVHLFTGGSTGTPQLWSKTPGNLLGEVEYLINRYAVGIGDRILATVPAMHIYGLLYSLLLPLVASARVVAQTPSFPEEIKQQMAEASPTIFVSVPIHYRALRDNPPDRGGLRLAFSSAGPLTEADGIAFSKATGVDLVEVYGSTETGGIATRCRAEGEEGLTPYDCIQWRVAGDSLDVRSPFLSRELPIRSSGWFTVSDRVKPHGREGFQVIGRSDSIVKVGGNRVDLEKVRQAIMHIEGVDEALVLTNAVETGRDSEIVALVVGSLSAAGVKTALDRVLEAHEKPRRLRMVEQIPMAATGKIDRRAVEKLTAADPIRFEAAGLTSAQLADGSRPACQAHASEAGTVTIPDPRAESSEGRSQTGIAGTYPVAPMTRRLTVAGCSAEPKRDHTPQSLVDWLARQVGDPGAATADIACLRRLGRYRDSLKTFTLVVHEETGIRRILKGEQTDSLGFAMDLGTTSMAGYLCNLKTGTLLAADACVNPQRRFGEDVITRIGRINENDEHLDQLQRLAAEGINFLMNRCLEKVGAIAADIDEVAVCGSTGMEQIVAGMHPYGLGIFPFFPLTLTPPVLSAGELGVATDPAVPVFLMPVISGFVGGDTMAAILADRPHERDEISLIVDIGTTGEIVLGNRNGLWAAGCATGPALEGNLISCGMRAVSGAIHRMWPADGDRRVAYDVLGSEGENRPAGICGSGIIDAVASLRRIDAIRPNGRLNEHMGGVVADEQGVGRHYTIATGNQSATGSEILVTLNDVRRIQLAKAALSTGIEFLMRKAGIEKIDRTILTGAFGARFSWRNALAIGMLPPVVSHSRVILKDNLAGEGVMMALLDKHRRSEARTLCRRIRYLELADDPDFAKACAGATAFPEIE